VFETFVASEIHRAQRAGVPLKLFVIKPVGTGQFRRRSDPEPKRHPRIFTVPSISSTIRHASV